MGRVVDRYLGRRSNHGVESSSTLANVLVDIRLCCEEPGCDNQRKERFGQLARLCLNYGSRQAGASYRPDSNAE